MKKLVLTLLASGCLVTAPAQLINPQSVGGSMFGALIGGVIGNSVHHQGWEGAAIGAGSGFVLGNLAYSSSQPKPDYVYGAPYAYSADSTYSGAPEAYRGAPVSYSTVEYSYAPASPDYSSSKYAIGGTLLGGLAGGIIGNNVHHQTWEGVAIGAASGLVLGSLADRNERIRKQSAPRMVISRTSTIADAPSVSLAQPAPVAPTYQPFNSMSSANSLFGR